MTVFRDVTTEPYGAHARAAAGRSYIAVIGIDRYCAWSRLDNAVSDARGAMDLFLKLGFELISPPLFDDQATGAALHRLVTSDLTRLRKQDSLVVFFAGHGHTVTRSFFGGASVNDGYIIPVDGGAPNRGTCTWIRLESWLKDITRLPAQHILVILDACHSGLALGSILQSRIRGLAPPVMGPMDKLRARRSRRIITSAQEDQVAMDRGPVSGHSLFTGCLIEALTHGLRSATDETLVTGSEIGLYVQHRVSGYQDSSQTPDFGTLELDDRGELVILLPRDPSGPSQFSEPKTAPDPRLLLPGGPERIIDVGTPEPVAALRPASHALPRVDNLAAPRARKVAASARKAAVRLVPVWRPAPRCIVRLAGVLCMLAITGQLVVLGLDLLGEDPTAIISSEPAAFPGADPPAQRATETRPVIETISPADPRIIGTQRLSPGTPSTEPTDVVQVQLFCDNGMAFAVYENGIKLFDGPGNLEVLAGQRRVIVVKIRGFHDEILVVDSTKKKVLFHLEPIHPLQGARVPSVGGDRAVLAQSNRAAWANSAGAPPVCRNTIVSSGPTAPSRTSAISAAIPFAV
jgi:Caspase domain